MEFNRKNHYRSLQLLEKQCMPLDFYKIHMCEVHKYWKFVTPKLEPILSSIEPFLIILILSMLYGLHIRPRLIENVIRPCPPNRVTRQIFRRGLTKWWEEWPDRRTKTPWASQRRTFGSFYWPEEESEEHWNDSRHKIISIKTSVKHLRQQFDIKILGKD